MIFLFFFLLQGRPVPPLVTLQVTRLSHLRHRKTGRKPMAENCARAPHAPPLFAHNLLCASAWLAFLSPTAVLLSSRSSPHRRRSISDLRLVILVFILGQSDIFFTVSDFTTNDVPSAPTFFALCPTRHLLQICLLCYFGMFCLLILRVEGFICGKLIFFLGPILVFSYLCWAASLSCFAVFGLL